MRRPVELELRIENEIAPILSELGYEWVGVQLSKGKGEPGSPPRTIVRVYLDKVGGITIDDIAIASRKMGAYFEVENIFPGHYVLEVSSPGLDRILFKPEHFLGQMGQKIQVSLSYPRDNQKNFQGILQSVENGEFSLVIEQKGKKQANAPKRTEIFSFEQIDKARVIPDFKIGKAGNDKKRGLEKE